MTIHFHHPQTSVHDFPDAPHSTVSNGEEVAMGEAMHNLIHLTSLIGANSDPDNENLPGLLSLLPVAVADVVSARQEMGKTNSPVGCRCTQAPVVFKFKEDMNPVLRLAFETGVLIETAGEDFFPEYNLPGLRRAIDDGRVTGADIKLLGSGVPWEWLCAQKNLTSEGIPTDA